MSRRTTSGAADGAEALRLIPPVAPDVVLLDIRMPEVDGLSVLRRLAEPGRAPHFIILTTFDDADAHAREQTIMPIALDSPQL